MAAALRRLLHPSTSSKLDRTKPSEKHKTSAELVLGSPKPATVRRRFIRACREAAKVRPAAEHHHLPLLHHKKFLKKGNGNSDENIVGGMTGAGGGGEGNVLAVGGGALLAVATSKEEKKSSSSTSGAVGLSESTLTHTRLVRTKRLMREYQEILKQQSGFPFPMFTVELVNDNLYEWNVKLYRVDTDSELHRDMCELGTAYILLNLSFPENFPFAPPFMRVISPRIEKGFVMEGGAICMELLTPGGWASAYTVEAIIMQFSASLVKGQGRIVRKSKGGKEFNKKAAEASFRSLINTHDKYGWVTPPLADG